MTPNPIGSVCSSSAVAYWVMAHGQWEYRWAVVSPAHSGGLGALSLAIRTAAATVHPGAILGQEQCRGCWLLARLLAWITCAPLLTFCAGSPWAVEAVGAWGVGHPGAETWSSALLAFLGIIGEKASFSNSYSKCQKQIIAS